MDKQAATERLDALEREAKELRKIIEGPDGLVYDSHKLYVLVGDSFPYILAGRQFQKCFSWHMFSDYPNAFGNSFPTEMTYAETCETGQMALDRVKGKDVHVFDDPVEGMTFFYEQYMKAHENKE